jgi:molybdenum cofactor cytidylyltransferase
MNRMTDTFPRRRVVAVLLAGGLSSRMGDFKQLMPFGRKTIVETCVETLQSSSVDDVVVVTGHRSDDVERVLAPYQVRIVRNTAYADGMSTSVIAGVRALDPGDAVMVCLCDQPHLPRDVFEAVLGAYRSSEAAIVVPTIAGDTGHPVIFDASLRDAILDVDPSVGLRSVTYANRDRTLRVPVDALGVLDDIDTQEDYERLR